MARLYDEASNGGYRNAADDQFGIVDQFVREYTGKNREIGWLSERAEIVKDELDTAQDKLVAENRKTMLEEFEKTADEKPKARERSNVYAEEAAPKNMPSRETLESISLINENMSESERFDALKDREITVQAPTEQSKKMIDSKSETLNDLVGKIKSQAEPIINALAVELGILNKPYATPDLDIEFLFSKNRELPTSLHHQMDYGGEYSDFAKALLHFDVILKNAVLIDQRTDKYRGTKREDRTLKKVSVLMGLFIDGDTLIPVEMVIKHSDYGNRLYMTVTMTKIEAGVMDSTGHQNDDARYLIPASENKK